MSQPQWKLIANLGDASPIEYGGYFVYVDETGVYPPEAEYLYAPDSDSSPEGWELYRFILEPCTFQNGILSDNKFHPDYPAWFAQPESERGNRPQDTTYLSNVAQTMDVDLDALREMFISSDIIKRAHAWRMIGEYHGFANLDNYPQTFKNRFRIERFARKYRKDWSAGR